MQEDGKRKRPLAPKAKTAPRQAKPSALVEDRSVATPALVWGGFQGLSINTYPEVPQSPIAMRAMLRSDDESGDSSAEDLASGDEDTTSVNTDDSVASETSLSQWRIDQENSAVGDPSSSSKDRPM